MKKYILILIVCFSCNAQKTILPQAQKQRSVVNQIIEPTPSLASNQVEELQYFAAHLLPLSQKATIQTAIDTYGTIRLEKGDYSDVNFSIGGNQAVYGHPTLTRVGNITIKQGSTNVVLKDLFPFGKTIVFEAGNPITNCTLKSIKYATLSAVGSKLENNTFVNILSKIDFDFNVSGYFRNNKIIRQQVQGHSNQLVLKGNTTTPSFGNVHLWVNLLTPAGDATNIDNLQSSTFVGLDSEAWNFSGTGTKAMMHMRNMGNVKFADLGGGNSYSTVQTPALDIVADDLFFLNKYIQSEGSSPLSKLSGKTNVLYVKGEHDEYVRDGAVTGFDLKANFTNGVNNFDVVLNNVAQTTAFANATVSNAIKGTQYTPWNRPTFETIPDPLGVNWRTERIGKTDNTAYIQNLINANGIAQLPEGVFYISSTLNLIVDGSHGITGSGSGKTTIVGLTDDFPLITLVESSTGDNFFDIHNLTLQGGSKGIFSPDEIDMVAFVNMRYVNFRDQQIGLHLYRNFGLDNCFFDHVNFINCDKGFFQDPNPVNTFSESGYVDKVVFYKSQFINCTTGVSMFATRANNLNAWIDCKFEGNSRALEMSGSNFPILANCDIVNNNGEFTVWGEMSLYNCKFQGNTVTKSTFMSKNLKIEGCNFLDNSIMFPEENHFGAEYYILNSTITGNVTRTYGLTQATYMNSDFLANPSLTKLLVNVKDNVPTVLINETPNPYPQLLVTQ